MSSSGKEPSTPTRTPRMSSSNDLISSQKQHVDDCIVIIDALQIAQNVNGSSPKNHSPKSNRPSVGSSAGSAVKSIVEEENVGGEDISSPREDLASDLSPLDPYVEIARLRSALTTVSLLAREAQDEIALEREEMVIQSIMLSPPYFEY